MNRLNRGLLSLLVGLVAIAPLDSQTPPLPTRLLGQTDLVYERSLTMPDVLNAAGNYGFEYTQGVIAFNPSNNSLFVAGHAHQQEVAEVRIPTLGNRATLLQGFADPFNGRIGQINPTDPNSKQIGGMVVLGDKLIITAYSFYDGEGTAVASHFVRSTSLGTGIAQGPYRVGRVGVAFTAGYFGAVPSVWQTALGGPLLNGQCCLSIISRTSYGPAAFSIDPATIIAGMNPAPATSLVYYPSDHPNLAAWDSTGPLFNGTTEIRGVVLPASTNTLLFLGRHGMGPFCYGSGEECNDPDYSSKGTHAYPYEPHVWAYRVSDLAAVRAGAMEPWDVKPYATWRLPGVSGAQIGGVTTDPTGRIFVAENYGDGVKLRIHILHIGMGRARDLPVRRAPIARPR